MQASTAPGTLGAQGGLDCPPPVPPAAPSTPGSAGHQLAAAAPGSPPRAHGAEGLRVGTAEGDAAHGGSPATSGGSPAASSAKKKHRKKKNRSKKGSRESGPPATTTITFHSSGEDVEADGLLGVGPGTGVAEDHHGSVRKLVIRR
eukprot:CAMPEP_0118978820 /NCGR_PEP_ID=MMETSP1173-20130426/24592_1 /TAXON_ID=1034831 /ORGANISM="Rhizochromulina marina cf, Strain CCMP1243" /LENGTH=145 /DNA_ID=CAMNT_0006929039 /DNA_START=82 /DNA_END=515 /DNA_ORIENTATION=-